MSPHGRRRNRSVEDGNSRKHPTSSRRRNRSRSLSYHRRHYRNAATRHRDWSHESSSSSISSSSSSTSLRSGVGRDSHRGRRTGGKRDDHTRPSHRRHGRKRSRSVDRHPRRSPSSTSTSHSIRRRSADRVVDSRRRRRAESPDRRRPDANRDGSYHDDDDDRDRNVRDRPTKRMRDAAPQLGPNERHRRGSSRDASPSDRRVHHHRRYSRRRSNGGSPPSRNSISRRPERDETHSRRYYPEDDNDNGGGRRRPSIHSQRRHHRMERRRSISRRRSTSRRRRSTSSSSSRHRRQNRGGRWPRPRYRRRDGRSGEGRGRTPDADDDDDGMPGVGVAPNRTGVVSDDDEAHPPPPPTGSGQQPPPVWKGPKTREGLGTKSKSNNDDDGNDDHDNKEDPKKQQQSSSPRDDTVGHFKGREGSMIADRYRIIKEVGVGTFGRVVECLDVTRERQRIRRRDGGDDRRDYHDHDQHPHRHHRSHDGDSNNHVAIKVVRNVKRYYESALIEADIIEDVNRRGGRGLTHCAIMHDAFTFRGHYCMVFECLGPSLYDFLKRRKYQPFPMVCVRDFAKQLLETLEFLHSVRLIHTDLKPENILLLNDRVVSYKDGCIIPESNRIKVIDFGGATYDNEKKSSIVNTRQYRAPEVILGCGWSMPSDMWSIGCILAELYQGELLFATHDNVEHLALVEQVIGHFPRRMLKRAKNTQLVSDAFDSNGTHRMERVLPSDNADFVKQLPRLESIVYEEDAWFLKLLRRILVIDPEERATARECLHKF